MERGDTVVVRMEAIDYEVFEVLRDFENSVANRGNPFALPASASTTVDGGLGGLRLFWGHGHRRVRALNGPCSAKNALYFQPKLNDMVSDATRLCAWVLLAWCGCVPRLGPGRAAVAARCGDMP